MHVPEIRHTTGTHPNETIRFHVRARQCPTDSAVSRSAYKIIDAGQGDPCSKTSVCGQRKRAFCRHAVSSACRAAAEEVFGQEQSRRQSQRSGNETRVDHIYPRSQGRTITDFRSWHGSRHDEKQTKSNYRAYFALQHDLAPEFFNFRRARLGWCPPALQARQGRIISFAGQIVLSKRL